MPNRKMSVLVVEDEKLLSWSLARSFQRWGFEAHLAGSAKEAKEDFEKNDYELVLLDYQLPDGNGLDVARSVRRIRPGVPILLMTSFDLSELSVDAGLIDGYFNKPLDLEALQRVVARLRVPRSPAIGGPVRARLAGLIVLVGAFVAAGSARAADRTYLGAEKCGKLCHKIEYASWLTTKHANALKSLKPEEQAKKECVQCHVTGGTVKLAGVQCEACHGPGSEYKSLQVMKVREKAIAAGLTIPTEKTCVKCHNSKSPHYKGFNFAESSKKVHDKKPKAATGP
jgi:CheY-like chemotaxis protein